MKTRIALLSLGTLLVASAAAAQDLTAVDHYVDAAPRSATESVSALASYLAGSGTTDLERARAIFRWLAMNVAYDVDGLRTGDYGDVSPGGVLRTGRAVCTGYAGLAEALGETMGLEIEMVEGWSKGYGYTVGQTFDGPVNHAWNAVRIEGKWRLMDPTWGAGYLDREMRFVRRFQEHYFLTEPSTFVLDHLPREPSWQLLESPVTADEYADLVYLRPHFFTNGLEVRSHDHALIQADDRVTVRLGAPDDVALVARLVDERGRDLDRSLTFVQVAEGEARIDAVFPAPGSYVLRLFARPKAQEGALSWALDYRVRASDGDPQGAFPTVFQPFLDGDVLLEEPMRGSLRSGETHRFRLRVPGAVDVAAVVEGSWVHFARDDGDDALFVGQVVAAGGDVTVYAQYPGADTFAGLLRYGVR